MHHTCLPGQPPCFEEIEKSPGKEGFYHRLGFRRMKTAMARFEDQQAQIDRGIIEP